MEITTDGLADATSLGTVGKGPLPLSTNVPTWDNGSISGIDREAAVNGPPGNIKQRAVGKVESRSENSLLPKVGDGSHSGRTGKVSLSLALAGKGIHRADRVAV